MLELLAKKAGVIKTNTPIKIINPENLKSVETKVHKKANYPKIFNIVISEAVAELLDLDLENPYVEVIEVKKNKTFIAKESNMFDEEKNVANTAPVNEVKMDDLTKEENMPEEKLDKSVKLKVSSSLIKS